MASLHSTRVCLPSARYPTGAQVLLAIPEGWPRNVGDGSCQFLALRRHEPVSGSAETLLFSGILSVIVDKSVSAGQGAGL